MVDVTILIILNNSEEPQLCVPVNSLCHFTRCTSKSIISIGTRSPSAISHAWDALIKVCLQVRDEHRTDYDQGRGGYGQLMWQEIEARQQAAVGQMDIDSGFGYEQQQQDYNKPAPQRRKKQQQQQQQQESYQPQSRNPRARGDDDDD